MKRVILMISFLGILTLFNTSYAYENSITTYNFFIKNNEVLFQNTHQIIISDSLDETILKNRKIAPGTSGRFNVNINISNGVISKYNLKFSNISKNFPKNIKFYFNGEEIDLKTFSLTDIQSSKKVSYEFAWKWEYETEDKSKLEGDLADILSSTFENLSFDIVLSSEYEEIKSTETLPRSGDIVSSQKYNFFPNI